MSDVTGLLILGGAAVLIGVIYLEGRNSGGSVPTATFTDPATGRTVTDITRFPGEANAGGYE